VSSLPTITEERSYRDPSMMVLNKSCKCKRPMLQSLTSDEESKDGLCVNCKQQRSQKLNSSEILLQHHKEEKGQVTEAGIADEEDSSSASYHSS